MEEVLVLSLLDTLRVQEVHSCEEERVVEEFDVLEEQERVSQGTEQP